MRLTLLLLLLLASGSASAGVKVAAPGLTATGVDPRIAAFFSEHLAQQLAHRGLGVTTAAEISTLLGLERQKQLLGCADCQVELGNALGVQGMVQGR
ncbi:MAG: hypothetical protein M3Y59_21860 [Myxococcota bacterium]|nr:hypothetical protein [Myxococcota bacterium]